jgi:hypothetical protein
MKKTIIFLFFIAASIWAQDRPYRVLVAYTQAVAAIWSDPVTEIENMIAHSNQIYDNSLIGQIKAEAVCIHQVNYVESDCFTDLNNFRFDYPTDNYMNEIFGLRDQYQADICALICASFNNGHDGAAYPYAPANNAFLDMVYSQSGSHVFAHEAGHIAGCTHCINQGCSNHDQSTYPVTYCHAKHQPGDLQDGWRTVMSNPWLSPNHMGWVIEVFSNPNINQWGVPVGTVADENNCSLMVARINGIQSADPAGYGSFAGFRPTPANLTLSEAIPAHESRLARATTSITLTNGFTVNKDAGFTTAIDPTSFGKRGRFESKPEQAQELMQEKTHFTIKLSGNNLTLKYKLVEKADVALVICNAEGRLVHAAKLGMKQPGSYNQNLLFPFAVGCYYINIKAGSYQSPKILVKK